MKKLVAPLLVLALVLVASICFSNLAEAGTAPENLKSVADETVIYLGDPITATSSSVVVSGTTAIITGMGTYRATGILTDGMIDVNTTEAVELILDSVAITHTAGPAINVTNAATVSLVLADGTSNTLIDGATYSDTSLKAALFSNDTLEISGNGALLITGKYKHGIASDDDLIINSGNITIAAAKKDGLHANDNITVNGGTIHVNQASSDGLESEGDLVVAGGALTLTATSDGIKSQTAFTMTGGSINVISGTEGIESKGSLTVNGGAISIAVSDDGLNATNDIVINGGQIYLNAAGDGVDSNGALTVNGGVLVALGSSFSGSGLDCITCTLNGGIVVATGSTNSTPSSASAQYVVVFSNTTPVDSVIHIAQDGTDALTFKVSKAYQSMIFSSPALTANTTYIAYTGGSISGGTDFYGLYTGATYSGGSVWSIFTINAIVTYIGDVVAIYLPLVANQSSGSVTLPIATGPYTQSGGIATLTNRTIVATNADESGVTVMNSGVLTLTDSTVTTSGNTSSSDNSSFYGLNAAVLAESASKVYLSGVAISTSGTGANGAFATGSGSSVVLTNVTITATNGGGHGVMATQGGVLTLTDVNIATSGANSAPIATDRGGGTITAVGGTLVAKGQDSPCIYSTGSIAVTDVTCTATGAESAVIEGANSIALHNTTLSSSKSNKWGVMIYQSMSGDAEGAQGVFTMTGGTLANTATTGPLFYVTNSTGIITLTNVSVSAASGTLLKAAAGNWGTSGSNGGTANLTTNGQTLAGNLVADSISSITAALKNSSALTGAIDADNTAKTVNLTLDSTSAWTVTADSHLTCLSDAGGISGTTVTNITGNGHTVYYSQSACSALGGATYTLVGGGYLAPES